MKDNERDISTLLTAECEESLELSSFRKKKEGIFFRKYDDGLYLRLGLNESAKYSDSIIVNPIFGVGWIELERLLSDLSDKKFVPYLFSSFSSNIGGFEVSNEARRIQFRRESLQSDVASFSRLVESTADKTMQKFCDHSSILEGLELYPPVQQRAERLICANHLLGNYDLALDLLLTEEEALTSAHQVMRDRFSEFARRYRSLLE